MEQTIKLNGVERNLKSNAMNAVIYRAAFGEDITSATKMFQNGIENGKIKIANLDAVRLMQLFWTMEKAANKDLEPFEKWVENLDTFPVLDVFSDIYDLVAANLTGVTMIKNGNAAAGSSRHKG